MSVNTYHLGGIDEDWISPIRSFIIFITTTSGFFSSEELTDRDNLSGNYGFLEIIISLFDWYALQLFEYLK